MLSRFITLLLILVSSYAQAALFKSDNTKLLQTWLSGVHHSGYNQINGKDISISLQVLPIWRDRIDGEWLYMESSVVDSRGKPFWQRVLQLVESVNGAIRLYSYSIPRASDFTGSYYDPRILASLAPSQLSLTSGCDIVLALNATRTFVGETDPNSCRNRSQSTPPAANFFAISEFNISFVDNSYDRFGNLVSNRLDIMVTFLKVEAYKGALINHESATTAQ